MLKKLRIQFICFTMALVVVMLCVIFGTVYAFTAENLASDSLGLMRTLAARPISPDGKGRPMRIPYLILRQTASGDWKAEGDEYFDLEDKAFLQSLIQAVDEQDSPAGVLKEQDLRFMRTEGRRNLYIFMDYSMERITLSHLVRTCVLIGFLSLVLFFGISLLLAHWALSPVETAWVQQKQFIADASHELKTPLAVILTNAELLKDPDYEEADHSRFRENILTMTYQMRNLVESLLELARLDSVTLTTQPLNLSALVERTTLPFEPVFFENQMLLQTQLTPNLWVRGSESHLYQVLEILLENAQKYASGGTVNVFLEASGNHCLLKVENEGTPLTQEDAKKIFLRFYRTDPARNRNGSYGLGLSIAQGIIHRHSGKIWAEGIPGGNRFCVQLPLCSKE